MFVHFSNRCVHRDEYLEKEKEKGKEKEKEKEKGIIDMFICITEPFD
jgi:hypothetical protein